MNEWPLSDDVRAGPIHRWQDAMRIPLGKTVFASGDDANYIALPGTGRKAVVEDPKVERIGIGSNFARPRRSWSSSRWT